MRNDYIVTKVEGERAPQIRANELELWLDADDPTVHMTLSGPQGTGKRRTT